jgi:uncharacterized membrane protein
VEIITAVLLIAMFVFIFSIWNHLPQLIPMHYNIAGVADRWGDRTGVLALPVIGTLLYCLFTGITVFPQIWNLPDSAREANKVLVYRITRSMLIFLKAELIASFFLLTIFSAFTIRLPVVFLPVLLAVIFGTVGVSLFQIFRYHKKT